jgi:3-oxoadipate enol-lactonase
MVHPPEPPAGLPPGGLVPVPGRGELFVRDTGGDGPPLLLLHGWTVSADLNWATAYAALADAGYRVLALDHRGHGRGLRTYAPFRLSDCADDAAALLRALGAAPALVAGYSMGGPIAQLLAREHPDAVRGVVLAATAQHWREPRVRLLWSTMSLLRLGLAVAPYAAWRGGLRRMGFADTPLTSWVASELTRGSARDIAEAGRELGRFDSRPWISSLAAPVAVVLTTRDTAVPPRKQRAMAEALGAPLFEVQGSHLAVSGRPAEFNAALLSALRSVAGAPAQRRAA